MDRFVTLIERPGYRLVRVAGSLDNRSAESRALDTLLAEQAAGDAHLAIDLSAVEYVNSSMLGSWIRTLEQLQARGRRLVLVNPPAGVRSILEMTGLSLLLPVLSDESAVPAALGGKAPQLPGDIDHTAVERELNETERTGRAPAQGPDSALSRLLDSI